MWIVFNRVLSIDEYYITRDVMLSKVKKYLTRVSIFKRKQKKIENAFDHLVFDVATDDVAIIWPAFGTLLGIFRDNGFISHDNDVDFAAWYKDKEIIRSYLEAKGCVLVRQFFSDSIECAYEEQYEKAGVKFDVFYFVKDNDFVYTHDFMRHKNLTRTQTTKLLGGLIVRRLNINVKNIVKFNYKGKNINFPENVTEHLSQRYGDSFMTPNPKWTAQEKNPFVDELIADGRLLKL